MIRVVLCVVALGCAPEPRTTTATLLEGAVPEEIAGFSERIDLVGAESDVTLLYWPDEAAEAAGLEGLEPGATRAFDLPVRIRDAEDGSPSVVSIVAVPAPWYATKAMITSAFRDREAEYLQAEGLPQKDFLISRGGQRREVGGVYLWRDEDAADAWYDDAWHADIEDRYGEPADLVHYQIR
ncbi:MAG: hypothetical protein KTR31_22745 [Myxococcales bacterium]|nr:hypothetical protein [Myxococcales bacterium]